MSRFPNDRRSAIRAFWDCFPGLNRALQRVSLSGESQPQKFLLRFFGNSWWSTMRVLTECSLVWHVKDLRRSLTVWASPRMTTLFTNCGRSSDEAPTEANEELVSSTDFNCRCLNRSFQRERSTVERRSASELVRTSLIIFKYYFPSIALYFPTQSPLPMRRLLQRL